MSKVQIPERYHLAHLPTPIYKMNSSFPNSENLKLYIKRDDYTGCEFSGNKIRKLEYILPEVIRAGYDVLITCGGLQSNHCRATAAVAARMGFKSHLVLKNGPAADFKSKSVGNSEGNYFMDQILGAEITFISDEAYRQDRHEIMLAIQAEYEKLGKKAYIIPEGASTGLGMYGYFNAFMEILEQEKEMNMVFDQICISCGSAGTYAGLFLANELMHCQKKIIGINIYDKDKDFNSIIKEIITEGLIHTHNEASLDQVDYSHIHMIQGYVDGGYGVSTQDELTFIKQFAAKEGIILDPVYTGKGLYGVFSEIHKKNPLFEGNVLFIHTGGLFGAFSKTSAFDL